MNKSSVFDCALIYLPKVGDRNGNITFVNNSLEIPFDVNRLFYLYDIPGGASRGAHAHKSCHQFLIAASGSFEIVMDDGLVKKQMQLNRPDMGLYIPPGIWAFEVNFSSGSICLVLASDKYSEKDYIRDYKEFMEFKLITK